MDQKKDPKDSKDSKDLTVSCVNLNQDSTCICVGTNQGFRIFHLDPFKLISERKIPGGISFCQMLFRTNIVCFVGTGDNKSYPNFKVFVFDDDKQKCIGELNYSFPVLSVQMKRGMIIVLLSDAVYMYEWTALKLIHKIETIANPAAICALRTSEDSLFAVPNITVGHIRVEFLDQLGYRSPKLIPAHISKISCLQFNHQGTVLASTSQRGTVIRLFNPRSGQLIREVRRGSDPANISSLSFHLFGLYLVCTSDKGTLHLWLLEEPSGREKNKTAFIQQLLPPYFQSQWSTYQYPTSTYTRALCTHDPSAIYLVDQQKGEVQKISFDTHEHLPLIDCQYETFSLVT